MAVYDFNKFKQEGESTLLWLKKEYTGIRTGRALPSILDAVSVKAYGSSMSIQSLATVSIEGPKTLRVSVWDADVVKEIDRAIRESNLGLSVAIDGSGLRISFPELTSERRTMLSKVAKEKLEEARVAIRTEREKTLGDIDQKEKSGVFSEDDKFRFRNELQKLVEDINGKLEDIFERKEKEILE